MTSERSLSNAKDARNAALGAAWRACRRGAAVLALTAASLTAAMSGASAHGATAGTLTIAHPYALPTPPGATSGGAYLKEISNQGTSADSLVGVSSSAADRVQLHEMRMDGDVMRMRPVVAIAIGAGQRVAMAPGNGYHLMFTGIHGAWKVGDHIPLTLQFERAGRVDVTVVVQERAAVAISHQRGMTER